MQKGQVYKIHSDFYYVKSNHDIYECKLRNVIKKQKQSILVGDFVDFENGAIEAILPRKNYIPRPSVANIDQIIIVSAVEEPALNLVQLNRYISFAKYYKINTVLCFNKNDLSKDDSIIEEIFKIYEPLGFDILFTSALEGYGIDDFREILKGKTSVFCGSSGVGKSSLINAVFSDINLRIGEVSQKNFKGTHTTRHCEIVEPDNVTRVVDTPGFSNLKFDFLMPNEIDLLFDEISQYKGQCKFQNCLHINETDCMVKSYLANIHPTRYDSYKLFVREAQDYKEKIKKQGTKTESTYKKINKKDTVKINVTKRQNARNTQKQNLYKEVDNGKLN